MRLFIAIPLPPEARKAALEAQKTLLSHVTEAGAPVPEENFHITLHFIGESQDMLGAAAALRQAAGGIRAFALTTEQIRFFSHGKTSTAYLALNGEGMAELSRLYEALEGALLSNGFPKGRKKLTPHITLLRGLPAPIEGLAAPVPTAFTATELVLFESRSIRGRMVYTPLHRETLL